MGHVAVRISYLLLLSLAIISGCQFFSRNESPVAYIDSISPAEASLGETVSFAGHGTDANGTVVAYRWRSSIDGEIGTTASFQSSTLSEGTHTIYLKVQDNNGAWSKEVQGTVKITASAVSTPHEEPAAATSSESESELESEGTTPGALPHINYFTAEPATIALGGSSRISWSVSNADSVVGSYDTTRLNLPKTGSGTVRPTRTTTYTLTATKGSSTVSATVTVVVESTAPPPAAEPPPAAPGLPVINSFTAFPDTIVAGESAELRWDVSNATRLTLTSKGTGNILTGRERMLDSTTVSPTTTTTYTLTATNTAGSKTASVTVIVYQKLPLVPAESGSITSTNKVSPNVRFGDTSTNNGRCAYLSFDTRELAGKNIKEAWLYCGSHSASHHGPRDTWLEDDLGSIRFYRVNYGPRPLQPGDFALSGPLLGELQQITSFRLLNVTTQMQNIARAGTARFQVKICFERLTDNDGYEEGYQFNDIIIRYR